MLNPGKDPDLKKLDTLHSKINTGNNSARNDYLEQLAKLTPEQLVLYKLWKPEQTRNPLPALPGEDVPSAKKWWQNLNKTIQLALMGAVPGIIGNLNGIPYTTRSKANDALMKELKDDPTTNKNTLTALNVIEDKLVLDNGKRNPDRSIISFDPNNGKPLAALAIGNLDTAGNVTWNVPGMNTTVSDGMESWADSAQDLYKNQTEEFKRLHKDGKNAVVAWIGYDTPPAPPASWGVLFTDAAVKGADKLQVALDGFQDTRGPGNGYTINVAAHSYGTTTSSIALTHTKYPVDTVAFFGSAGIDPDRVPNAAAMHVNHGTDGQPAVYETHASDDMIAPSGIVGSNLGKAVPIIGAYIPDPFGLDPREDPTDPWFGGHNFSSEGGYDTAGNVYDRVTGHDANGSQPVRTLLFASEDHGYLNQKTESGHNIALVTTGQGEKIQTLSPLKYNPDGSLDDSKFYGSNRPHQGWQPSDWDINAAHRTDPNHPLFPQPNPSIEIPQSKPPVVLPQSKLPPMFPQSPLPPSEH
ncbi:hypothetical protein FHU41_002753 [Psychromicrobium silvestre]|uniref:DUF1023 domain-containing protein n=1 Tax=Psychromicrobium silvestre TaxID=1645614 RepID=A0A7Y9LVQ9_9MICC|nr:alpha/beta hydrolase [Psychromicrobium silvestre]NYE96503.1 hypothetical protein [Psychromicrobium silvestre]